MRNAYNILVGKLKGQDHSENLDVDVKTMLEWILREMVRECVDLIHLAHETDHWRALMNMVMNLRVPHSEGNFLTS